MKTVFMGTPDFAVPSLEALARSDHEIIAVLTRKDKPRGRHGKPLPPPVKKSAGAAGLKIIQPGKVKPGLIEELAPDVLVVVAFHQILKKDILTVPPAGCVNLHASLLPRHRGASPINSAILKGDGKTGVTTILMDEGIDTGDILMQREMGIGERDDAGILHDRLAVEGAGLLRETLDRLEEGRLDPEPQDDSKATYSPLLKKDDGRIDWNAGVVEIDRHVRAMIPWPGTFTHLGGMYVKIISGEPGTEGTAEPPGTVIGTEEDCCMVSCGEGRMFRLIKVQPEGRKKMTGGDFVRGGYGRPGDRFE